MSEIDIAPSLTIAALTTPGWYRYDGGMQAFMFLLDRSGRWWATFDNGDHDQCDWGYIEQSLGVFSLLLVTPLGGTQ